MNVKWQEFKELNSKIEYRYFYTGLPFGGLRVFSKDPLGQPHSLVLTRGEAIKLLGLNRYMKYVEIDNTDIERVFNTHPWFEYEEKDAK